MDKEADIIFVGGGTSACVAAGRLAAANPDLEILLIEQGPDNFKDPSVSTPALFPTHLSPESKTALFWRGTKSEATNGRETGSMGGGIFGGGSSINFMMYARPAASDFDDWNTVGWGSQDLIPLLQKISYSGYFAQIAQEYLDVCADRGIPVANDLMDFHTGHGSGRLAKYIDPITGQRQDAAHQFIHTQSRNKSLRVVTKTLVTRVLFEGTKAIGVEVITNKKQDANADPTPRKITARKLIVVSSGAIPTPLILQRSGVGDATLLRKLGINVVVDLPGVGTEYQDHGMSYTPFFVPGNTDTCDPLLAQEPRVMDAAMAQFKEGRGLLTSNFNDAGSKIRPTTVELKGMGPAFNQYWKQHFESAPDKPFLLRRSIRPPSIVPAKSRLMMFANFVGYPISRGYVRITSTDPYAPPDFCSGVIEEQADVEVHKWIYKKTREVARRMPSYRGELALLHPKFPEGSAAACIRLDEPLPKVLNDLVYTTEDNKAIEDFVRQFADATPHSLGTVRMSPKENGGCVDARLNVYGTTQLKIADLSILPGNVGANPYSSALLVGEKAAFLIAEDLGLNLP
ncbi:unnamed protein product [Rhizoctonia solani]|uniref:Glucose-methanol-choline oxidoreductase N-terminal domain-containing protein n=1 Tax=Rhizoctonia solani TaxID=456999 RepID=A0A8H3H6V0_9AGAM|nr:unnamed protein product [Rhizoctonia solani]